MRVMTPDDLFDAAVKVADGQLSIKNVVFADRIYARIKIDDEGWRYSKEIDYRSASVIIKFQKDILGIYNKINDCNVDLRSLASNKHLIVAVSVEEGCIEYIWEIPKKILEYTKDMDSKAKIASLLICLAGVAIGCGAWVTTSYFDFKKAELEAKKQIRGIEALEKSNMALIENQRTPSYVAKHISDDGKVTVGAGRVRSGKEFKTMVRKPDMQPAVTVDIDAKYKIVKMDYDSKCVQLAKDDLRPFWASFEWLNEEQKEILKSLSNQAIDSGMPKTVPLQVSAKIVDGEIRGATIFRIGAVRASAKGAHELLKTRVPTTSDTLDQQLKLPCLGEDPGKRE